MGDRPFSLRPQDNPPRARYFAVVCPTSRFRTPNCRMQLAPTQGKMMASLSIREAFSRNPPNPCLGVRGFVGLPLVRS